MSSNDTVDPVGLFDDASYARIALENAQRYQAAAPFPHIVLEDFIPDPLARARCILQALNIWSEAYEERVWDDARTRINQAVARAESIPEPDWSTLFDDVYAEIPPALLRQRHDLLENEQGFERRHEGEFPL